MAVTVFGHGLECSVTAIPGLTVWRLPVHGDSRGWFKENWQRETMAAAGLPDFGPVQNNVSFNDAPGTTRGVHAEPWDKWVSVATGRIFGAWVDLREGATFGTVVTAEIDPSAAVFVPRGVGNAYQTLEPNTAYTYLVNDHWSPDATYTFLNIADDTAGIAWPIPLAEAVISDKDRAHPCLADVTPIPPRKILLVGGNGQVGRAIQDAYAGDMRLDVLTRADLDLAAPDIDAHLATLRDWRDYEAIINAAAYTAVDTAETPDGRRQAWAINVTAVAALAAIARRHRLTLVHLSSDYVFDGATDRPYRETDPVCPLGVYGQTKAASELAAATAPRHYILRTSWVIGDGHNFVRTMADLAERGINPAVVNDQTGRPTFTTDLAAAIQHLLHTTPDHGTYHVTGAGEPATWHTIAQETFRLTGHDPARVHPTTTSNYTTAQHQHAAATGHDPHPTAPRPATSTLDTTKAHHAGIHTTNWHQALTHYLTTHTPTPTTK